MRRYKSMSAKSDHEAIAQSRQLLVGTGLKMTAARIAVIRWLQNSKSPASHAEIAGDLVPLGFDTATVFRNLNDLVDAGLVTRTELGDHVWRFELRDASHSDRGRHPHLCVCVCVCVCVLTAAQSHACTTWISPHHQKNHCRVSVK